VQSDESDHTPKMKLIDMSDTESEGERRVIRRKKKGKGSKVRVQTIDKRPKIWKHVKIEMRNGEIIFGRITAKEKTNMDYFFMDTNNEKNRLIDLRDVADWFYKENP